MAEPVVRERRVPGWIPVVAAVGSVAGAWFFVPRFGLFYGSAFALLAGVVAGGFALLIWASFQGGGTEG